MRKFFQYLSKRKFNPLHTIFFNFYYLPFKQAIKLPIYFYGIPKFISCSGKVIIDCEKISSGMIRINQIGHNPYHSSGNFEYVNDDGIIIFKGKVNITGGTRILIYNNGKLILGDKVRISSSHIGIRSKIVIGYNVAVVAAKIYDTNFHYIYNLNNNLVKNSTQPIFIGNNVWIGTNATILKGNDISDFCIISANSNLSIPLKNVPKNSIIAGNPAKVITTGFQRVFNKKTEQELIDYFNENTEAINTNKYSVEQL